MTEPTTHTLDVPGAVLTYDVRAPAGEAVDRDVHPVDPGGDEVGGLRVQEIAIGGEREVFDSVYLAEDADELDDTVAEGGLATSALEA